MIFMRKKKFVFLKKEGNPYYFLGNVFLGPFFGNDKSRMFGDLMENRTFSIIILVMR